MKLEQLISAFETLTPETVTVLAALYAEDARFTDPFNKVQGRTAIASIFRHMFQQVKSPRFVVTERVVDGANAFLVWDFHFQRSGQVMTIRGGSHIRFGADGLVTEHRDYWDAAGELYAQLPIIGSLMRFMQRRLSASRA